MKSQSESAAYEEGMKAVTQSLPIIDQVLHPNVAESFHEGIEDGKHIKSIIEEI